MKEEQKEQFSEVEDALTLAESNGMGFIHLDSFTKDLTKRPTIVPLDTVASEVNTEIIVSKSAKSLAYMNTHDEFVVLPFLHNNEIPFQNMRNSEDYLVRQKCFPYYVAWDIKEKRFVMWNMINGKQETSIGEDKELASQLEGY